MSGISPMLIPYSVFSFILSFSLLHSLPYPQATGSCVTFFFNFCFVRCRLGRGYFADILPQTSCRDLLGDTESSRWHSLLPLPPSSHVVGFHFPWEITFFFYVKLTASSFVVVLMKKQIKISDLIKLGFISISVRPKHLFYAIKCGSRLDY